MPALPARFRQTRLLLIGCGDIGQRVAKLLKARVRLFALTSTAQHVPLLRALGITPLSGNLDHPASLWRLSGLAQRLLHLAPPPEQGTNDPRSLALTRVLRRRGGATKIVYGSTSGVYGDCGGAVVTETRQVNPATSRSQRRLDAEHCVRHFGRSSAATASILRIPGIYGTDRVAGTPRERLRRGTPVLQASDDVFTNHIEADDLARACCAALWRGQPQRIYNINDDSCLKMGDYFDLAADLFALPRPARLPRSTASQQLPLMLLSFMSESRRMNNTRMKQQLRLRLRYPNVADGLQAG